MIGLSQPAHMNGVIISPRPRLRQHCFSSGESKKERQGELAAGRTRSEYWTHATEESGEITEIYKFAREDFQISNLLVCAHAELCDVCF